MLDPSVVLALELLRAFRRKPFMPVLTPFLIASFTVTAVSLTLGGCVLRAVDLTVLCDAVAELAEAHLPVVGPSTSGFLAGAGPESADFGQGDIKTVLISPFLQI